MSVACWPVIRKQCYLIKSTVEGILDAADRRNDRMEDDDIVTAKELFCFRAGALVYWFWDKTHVMKVVGSNQNKVYWMDVYHINLL